MIGKEDAGETKLCLIIEGKSLAVEKNWPFSRIDNKKEKCWRNKTSIWSSKDQSVFEKKTNLFQKPLIEKKNTDKTKSQFDYRKINCRKKINLFRNPMVGRRMLTKQNLVWLSRGFSYRKKIGLFQRLMIKKKATDKAKSHLIIEEKSTVNFNIM